MPKDKIYSIKEIYYTLQGEGAQTGRPAVFCRFSGCNLWTGKEKDRPKAVCQFCDTDFWGTDGENGGKYTRESLTDLISMLWPSGISHRYVVCTGGEPLLQMDTSLIETLHDAGFEVAVETNGTVPCPEGLDWICMSPKANTDIVVTRGNECKLVYPQPGILPEFFEHMDFQHFFIQPMDSEDQAANIRKSIDYCKSNPRWKLSLQTHKLVGIK